MRGGIALRDLQRHGTDGADVGGDVVAPAAVAAGGGLYELAIFAQRSVAATPSILEFQDIDDRI